MFYSKSVQNVGFFVKQHITPQTFNNTSVKAGKSRKAKSSLKLFKNEWFQKSFEFRAEKLLNKLSWMWSKIVKVSKRILWSFLWLEYSHFAKNRLWGLLFAVNLQWCFIHSHFLCRLYWILYLFWFLFVSNRWIQLKKKLSTEHGRKVVFFFTTGSPIA